jgi:ANTAR domain
VSVDRRDTIRRVSAPLADHSAASRIGVPPDAPHPVELAGLLHELSIRLLGADDLTQALSRLAEFAAGAVPGAVGCSVALIGERSPLTHAAAGPAAQALDDRQYAVGRGPGLDAARTRTLVTAKDLPADERWPELAECAGEHGVRSVAAIPMDVQRASVGSLSVLVSRGHGIDPDLLLTAMAIVNQAEVLLAELRRRETLREGAAVDRAVGVIIAQRGCGVHEAYDVLRETSQRLGLDHSAVAQRLVAAAARNADA